MTLSEWLAQNREQTTIADFAARVGVRATAVYKWRAGENVPRPRQMRRIVDVTNGEVTPADFYAPRSGAEAA